MSHPAGPDIDPTFYRSPADAISAPPEKLAYVVAFDRAGQRPDALVLLGASLPALPGAHRCRPADPRAPLIPARRCRPGAGVTTGVTSATPAIFVEAMTIFCDGCAR